MMTMKIHGLRELEAQLLGLQANLAQKAIVSAARKAFQPVLAGAQARVARDSGQLHDSLKIVAVKPKAGDAVVVVGLRVRGQKIKGDAKLRKSASWRWHFVEFGTAYQAARPYLRPALESNSGQVIETFKKELAKAIQKALKKGRSLK